MLGLVPVEGPQGRLAHGLDRGDCGKDVVGFEPEQVPAGADIVKATYLK